MHTLCYSFISTSDSSVVEGSINKLNDPSVNRVESGSPEMFPILCMTAKTCTEHCSKICSATCRSNNDLKS